MVCKDHHHVGYPIHRFALACTNVRNWEKLRRMKKKRIAIDSQLGCSLYSPVLHSLAASQEGTACQSILQFECLHIDLLPPLQTYHNIFRRGWVTAIYPRKRLSIIDSTIDLYCEGKRKKNSPRCVTKTYHFCSDPLIYIITYTEGSV